MILEIKPPQYYPTVSLLIAMRNEEKFIAGCLESLLSQDYPSERIEVLILDGMSTDNSREVVEKLIEGKSQFHLLLNLKVIQSAAWNLGIEKSHGEIVTIVSAHSILANDYISNAIETILRTGADLVGGPMTSIGEDNIAKVISIATSNPFGMGDARFHYTNKEEIVDTVYMGFCYRKLYEKIGGFDEEMVRNQDDELSYRILDHGGVIICNPEIKSQYYNRTSFRSLWKQYFQYGYWKVRVVQKHPKQMRLRQFVPPAFAGILIGSLLLTLSFVWGWILLAMVTGSYLVANLIATCISDAKKGWLYLILLPFTFSILHLSYGLGFLAGLTKFWYRWGDKKGKVPVFESQHA
jgi:glycosyltransferase involved in cell wall biosynthesis